MNCATHPDVPAMDVCRVCGRPVCSMCVYFDAGAPVCGEHAPAVPGVPAVSAVPAVARPVPYQIQGAPAGAPPMLPDTPAGWEAQLRLEPLPMAQRPGWPDEPMQARPSTLPETLGIIGLIVSLLTLPFSACCGAGAVVGLPLALVGGGLAIAGLIMAPRSRNPATARWTGGVGAGVALLGLAINICSAAALLAMTTGFNSTILATP